MAKNMIDGYNRAVAGRKEAKNREASRKEEGEEEEGVQEKRDDEEGELCSMLTLLAFGATKC